MLAYDFPLLSAFVLMLFFFLWLAWIIVLVRTIIDIFRSDDLSGGAKAAWLLFVAIIPWLGVLAYLISRGDKMAEREVRGTQAQEAAFRDYVQQAAGSSGGGTAAELARLADLRDRGVLTDEELAAQKAKLLA
jgi:Short C-terminal domain/Phospholipase_D-nuclease N-terminal